MQHFTFSATREIQRPSQQTTDSFSSDTTRDTGAGVDQETDSFVFSSAYDDSANSSDDQGNPLYLSCMEAGDTLAVVLTCYNEGGNPAPRTQDVSRELVTEFFGDDGYFDGDNKGLWFALLHS